MQQYGSKKFIHKHILDPRLGSKDYFSEGRRVAYQIKGNGA